MVCWIITRAATFVKKKFQKVRRKENFEEKEFQNNKKDFNLCDCQHKKFIVVKR